MVRDVASLRAALGSLQASLLALPAGPVVPSGPTAGVVRHELIDQIGDYLLPRLAHLEAPLLVGIGGSTGAGKSTITNTLVGDNVTATGLLRPTTRTPVLVCHPDDARWFLEGGVLPGLPRTSGRPTGDGAALTVRTSAHLVPGVAVLDTPDIDSVEIANHELAAQLLGAADLWLFVTTAGRYADAVPWEYLRTARERGVALAIAVNRIPPGAGEEVVGHMREMLDANDLGGVRLFAVGETELTDARLTERAAAELRSWLAGLGANAAERNELVLATIDGAVGSIPGRIEVIARAVEEQVAAAAGLAVAADNRYDEAAAEVARRLDGGTMLRSEVLLRWQELVGVGRLMQSLQSGIARIRDRLRSLVSGTPTLPAEIQGELQTALRIAITEAADTAADATVEAWEATDGGRRLLGDQARALARPSPGLAEAAASEMAAWQDFVLGLVRHQAEGRQIFARTLSLGINTIGAALMVVLFAHTGGLTGGEVAVAGGTATVSQALLTALFGESAVRDLARQARGDLLGRVERLLDGEASRFHALLRGMPSPQDVETLRSHAGAIAAAAR